jgi:hypothetical protein
VATQDPRALSLYLRYGVRYVATSVDMIGRPTAISVPTDLAIERLDPSDERGSMLAVTGIERALLGHARDEDVRFLLAERPAWVARRGRVVVGFAFGASGSNTGPVAALVPSDLPTLLAVVESDAAERELDEISFGLPMVNTTALEHLLARRFQIDPFYTFILASHTNLQLDRWIHTGPAFIL